MTKPTKPAPKPNLRPPMYARTFGLFGKRSFRTILRVEAAKAGKKMKVTLPKAKP